MAENITSTSGTTANTPTESVTNLPQEKVVDSTVNTPVAETAEAPTPFKGGVGVEEVAPEIPTAEKATEQVIQKQQEAIERTQEVQEGLQDEADTRIEEEAQIEKERVADAAKFAKEQNILEQKSSDASIGALERSTERAEAITQREVGRLKAEAKSEKELAELALAKQKFDDEQAIKQAERTVEIERQKATWAFNKLGLGFSSGIIQETQAIATRGATEIAGLKIEASYNQAKLQLEASKIQSEYSSQINSTIDKFVDLQDKNETAIVKQINETQSNISLNNREMQIEINRLKDNYLTNTRQLENQLKLDIERLADKQVTQAKVLETTIREKEAAKKVEFNQMVTGGTYFNMGVTEQQKLASEMGLSLDRVNASIDTLINSSIRSMYDSIVGPTAEISNAGGMLTEVKELMKNSGYSLERAINEVALPNIKDTAEYKAKEEASQRDVELKKLQIDEAKTRVNKLKGLTSSQKTSANNIVDKLISGNLGSIDGYVGTLRKLSSGAGLDNAEEDFISSMAQSGAAGSAVLQQLATDALGLDREDIKGLTPDQLTQKILTTDGKEVREQQKSDERAISAANIIQDKLGGLGRDFNNLDFTSGVDTGVFDFRGRNVDDIKGDIKETIQLIKMQNPDITSEEILNGLKLSLPEKKGTSIGFDLGNNNFQESPAKEGALYLDGNTIKAVKASDPTLNPKSSVFGSNIKFRVLGEDIIDINNLLK